MLCLVGACVCCVDPGVVAQVQPNSGFIQFLLGLIYIYICIYIYTYIYICVYIYIDPEVVAQVQPNSGFIQFLLGLERRLFGATSSSAADFAHVHAGDAQPGQAGGCSLLLG